MTRLQSRSLLVGMLVLASLALLGLNQTGALNPIKGALTIPLTGLQRGLDRVWGNLTSFFNRNPDVEALRQHNADLEAQITQLQARVTELEEHEAERLVLAGLLNYAREQPDNRYLAANVIGQDASPFLSYLFLDQGSD
ncbi:MAG: hypothetical protein ACRDH2_12070, partial [Anaerolineales bacterium]